MGRKKTTDAQPAADRHANKGMTIRLTPEAWAAAEALAEEERRKITQMVAILVEDALIAKGRLAPRRKPADQQPPAAP